MEYQLKMVYDQSDVGALVRALQFRSRPEKNLRLAVKIAYPVFGVLLVAVSVGTAVAMLTAGLVSVSALLLTVVTFIGGVALLRRSNGTAMERRSWKRYPNKGMTVTYTFYKDRFETEDEASGHHEFSYTSLANALEDDNHFFLFTVHNNAHMLRKDSFTQGDPATFAKFLHIRAALLVDPVE